jgi:hypothetical protein
VAATAWVFVNLPADYFVGPKSPAFWSNRHPFLRWFGRVGKNLLGGLLVIVGIILSIPGVPGQGILTILIGLMFVDLPGKRRLEQRLVQRPRILAVINNLRRRYGRPDLVFESNTSSIEPIASNAERQSS